MGGRFFNRDEIGRGDQSGGSGQKRAGANPERASPFSYAQALRPSALDFDMQLNNAPGNGQLYIDMADDKGAEGNKHDQRGNTNFHCFVSPFAVFRSNNDRPKKSSYNDFRRIIAGSATRQRAERKRGQRRSGGEAACGLPGRKQDKQAQRQAERQERRPARPGARPERQRHTRRRSERSGRASLYRQN